MKWTKEEVEYLIEYFDKRSYTNMKEHLNRTYNQIYSKARRLGILNRTYVRPKKMERPKAIYSNKNVNELREYYAGLNN